MEKIDAIAKEIYGADGLELSEQARQKVALYENQVFRSVLILTF